MFDKIHHLREQDRHHLRLCQEGHNRHFHLEQPYESENAQPELMDAGLGTLPATFDMCHVGGLQLPNHAGFLQKCTQVFTTSRHIFETLNQQFCHRSHSHVPIKGHTKTWGKWVQISRYAKAYTAGFTRKIAWRGRNPQERKTPGQ